MSGCPTCGRKPQWHGSETAVAGTCLMETGCHDGVRMDDDEYHEGWHRDVVYPPCQFNPKACAACFGSGVAPLEYVGGDDCPKCEGTGWHSGRVEWPTPAAAVDAA